MRYVLPDGRFWEGELRGSSVSLRWGTARDARARNASFKSVAAAKQEFAMLERKIISMGFSPAAPPAKKGFSPAAPPAKKGFSPAAPPAKKGFSPAAPPAKKGFSPAPAPGKRGYRRLTTPPAELIAALAAKPADDSPLVVYGDQLLAAGDLRGELASLAVRKKKKALRDFLLKHAAALFGDAEDDVHEGRASDLTWAPGFVRDVRFVAEDEEVDLVALTRRFVSAPVAAFLRGVKFSRALDGAWGRATKELARLPAPELLTSLEFADDVGGDEEWFIDAGQFEGVLSRFRGLRTLALTTSGFEPGELMLPALRTFERRGGNYTRAEVKAYEKAKWPKLETVTLGFANTSDSGDVEAAAIKHFFNLGGALRELSVSDLELGVTSIEELLDGKTLERLEVLDLSTCTADDEAGQLLSENLDVLKKLKTVHFPRSPSGAFELEDFSR